MVTSHLTQEESEREQQQAKTAVQEPEVTEPPTECLEVSA